MLEENQKFCSKIKITESKTNLSKIVENPLFENRNFRTNEVNEVIVEIFVIILPKFPIMARCFTLKNRDLGHRA